jgi:pimeloyl-ACP methyl ester carboxylesterase
MRLESVEFQGCRLAYRIDGSGPPLIVIQGVGARGVVPNPLTEQLLRHYTCLSFDNRGIGDSQPAGKALSAEQMADDVMALMNHIGWDSAHVMGHSFGGLIALQLTLVNPARVRSLSLLCSFARGAGVGRLSPGMLWILLRLRFGTRQVRRRAFMAIVLPPGDPRISSEDVAARLSAILGHDVGDAPPIMDQQMKAMRQADVTPRLGEIRGIPTLVVNGDRDMIAPPELGKAIAARIPDARYIEIPGAAHSFPVLEPERCAGLMMEHIARAEGSGQA